MTRSELKPIFDELYETSEVFDPKGAKYTALLALHWKQFGDRPTEQYRRGVDEYLKNAMTRDFPSVAVLRDAIIESMPPPPIVRREKREPTEAEKAEHLELLEELQKKLDRVAEGMKI